MVETYILHRIYLQNIKMLKNRTCSVIVPVNFNYQNTIIVNTGLFEHSGKQFVFLTSGCGCGPQPTIWGAYFQEMTPWSASELHTYFSSCDKEKDRRIAEQKMVNMIYRIRLLDGKDERAEVAAALHGRFGTNKEISFL